MKNLAILNIKIENTIQNDIKVWIMLSHNAKIHIFNDIFNIVCVDKYVI